MNRLRRTLPHAAIVLCNMYIVFFLIDRVNTAMNFIDNRLTKGLLLALVAVDCYNAWMLRQSDYARRRQWGKILAWCAFALSGVIVVLTVLDAIWPNWNIFLAEFTKYMLLAYCLLSAVIGMLLYAHFRRNARRSRRGRSRVTVS